MERAAYYVLSALRDQGVLVSATVLSGGVPSEFEPFDVDLLDGGERLTRLIEIIPKLRSSLSRRAPDVVVGSGLWASVPLGVALIGLGPRFVHWEHSLLEPRLQLDPRLRLLANCLKLVPKSPELVVAVSNAVLEAARLMYSRVGEFEVIPNVVIEPNRRSTGEELRTLPPETGVRLLTTGAFRQYKNYRTAVTAMLFLPQRFTLTMVGDGPQREMLEALVAKYGLGDRVSFRGRVPNVRDFLLDADLLVHPSLAETFGFSLVEAAHYRVPVVNLPAPAMSELVPVLVPGATAAGFSPEQLAYAINIVASNPPSSEDFDTARDRRSVKFSPDTVGRQWCNVLDRFAAVI
ncbi:glycosyltransferase family 4 protein [Actinomycetospora sp. NBRC 106378]|uniref:glycosyltransferase family 4 protein n=1 Tax=Actinomycetospora sp. NBRC 106378 TaxID=3032208 RepID=UPI0025537F5F|nr:glycosyltransferase family 4 protein [Actinomycetospora sp. NBRC 106378]